MKGSLENFALEIKKEILNVSFSAQVGHIGSALSIADVIAVLYWGHLRVFPRDPLNEKRDRFVLSKGHAVCALYAALYLRRFISRKQLYSYCKNGTLLGSHPDHFLPGIEVSTGSLGHGLAVGCGMALAGKLNKKNYKVFVLISDAECDEGAIWESALFASQHKLDNLTIIVDYNKVQAFGTTKEILDLEPFVLKWKSFGCEVVEVDGHNLQEIKNALNSKGEFNKPKVVLAHTVRGKGVSFMEGKMQWHYLTVDKKQLAKALREIIKK